METALTTSYTGPDRRKLVNRVARAINSGGFSLGDPGYPTLQETREIEGKGFVVESVQAHLDGLEQGTPADIRTAAMLRGAINDLLGRTVTLDARP